MFPYSLGIQAPTKAKAVKDFTAQIDQLAKVHPDEADQHSPHLEAVHAAARALVELLPDDDEASDVALSAAGYLTSKKNEEGSRIVQSATVTVFAGRCARDASKHTPDEKIEKPPEKLATKGAGKAAVDKE
jgi:hypothetical protein